MPWNEFCMVGVIWEFPDGSSREVWRASVPSDHNPSRGGFPPPNLALLPTGLSFPVCHGGGRIYPPQLKSHLGVLDSNSFYTCFGSYIYLAKIKKKFKKILKQPRNWIFEKISEILPAERSSQKCPLFGQNSIFWALVFCKHPYFYSSNWFYKENIGL